MANSRGPELAPFFAACSKAKYGTVGWLIHNTLFDIDGKDEDSVGYDLDVQLCFATHNYPNLSVLSVYEGEDGSVVVDLG